MKYFLWKAVINDEDYSVFAIAANLEEAKRTAIRNCPVDCRESVRMATSSKPTIINGPYSFLVKAKVDFDCKHDE